MHTQCYQQDELLINTHSHKHTHTHRHIKTLRLKIIQAKKALSACALSRSLSLLTVSVSLSLSPFHSTQSPPYLPRILVALCAFPFAAKLHFMNGNVPWCESTRKPPPVADFFFSVSVSFNCSVPIHGASLRAAKYEHVSYHGSCYAHTAVCQRHRHRLRCRHCRRL